jgi:hypothetical protein
MDPLRPVDPDEEFPRKAADKPAAIDSDFETPAENQPGAVPERRPADDGTELIDDPVGGEPDSIILPPSNEASTTNAVLPPSDDADVIPSSALATVPNDAATEAPSAFFDSAPAAEEAGPALNAEQLPSIEPVDTSLPTDLILPPNHSGAVASADRAIPRDPWSDTSSALDAVLQQTPLPVIDPLNTDAPITSPGSGSFKDRSSLTVDQKPSREGIPNDQGKHDVAPLNDVKPDQAHPRPDAAPVEQQEDANRRAEIERFIENFNAQSARTDALLSPPFDGGPPMARPIVLVSLDEEQMQGITNETLSESGSRTAKLAAELAQVKVDEAFWLRDCEMRALYRGR